jgi:hypothetical protein
LKSIPTSNKIDDDPFGLLEAIKTLMHNPLRAQCFTISATNAMSRAINIRQGETEPTSNFSKRFKQECDVMMNFMGEDFLHHLIEQTPECRNAPDTTKKQAMKKSSFKRWPAQHMIMCANQARHGMLTKQLNSQCSLGNNQWPDSPNSS